MKRFLSLISAVVFVMAVAPPALAQNKTASNSTPKTNASATTSQSNSEGKSTPKHHASSKTEQGKSNKEKRA